MFSERKTDMTLFAQTAAFTLDLCLSQLHTVVRWCRVYVPVFCDTGEASMFHFLFLLLCLLSLFVSCVFWISSSVWRSALLLGVAPFQANCDLFCSCSSHCRLQIFCGIHCHLFNGHQAVNQIPVYTLRGSFSKYEVTRLTGQWMWTVQQRAKCHTKPPSKPFSYCYNEIHAFKWGLVECWIH